MTVVSQPPNFLGTPNAFGEVGEAPLLGVGAAGEATVASWLESLFSPTGGRYLLLLLFLSDFIHVS